MQNHLGIFTEYLSGPIGIPMTNDYLFRAILQRNNQVLISLLSSLLGLQRKDIISADIENPIELGKAIDDKEFILDIKVLLNGNRIINLEMQVIDEKNWIERSTIYLCRAYDNLNRGEDYQDVKEVLQIGLLNFTLFPEQPEFYAKYRFLNTKSHYEYTGKIGMNVLDLTQIDLATSEDRENHIDYWAKFFKARTWEEIDMLAEQYEDLKEAATTVYQVSREEDIRLRCEAREDYYKRQRGTEKRLAMLAKKEAEIKEKEAEIKEKEAEIKEKETEITEMRSQLKEKDARIAELEKMLDQNL